MFTANPNVQKLHPTHSSRTTTTTNIAFMIIWIMPK